MGGTRHIRSARVARHTRTARRTGTVPGAASGPVLVLAVATLLAALFLCTAPAGHHPVDEPAAGATVGTAERFSCPLDTDDCRLFPRSGPAVLTAPLLDPGAGGGELPRGAVPPSPASVAVPEGAARPRAPDLHVLQVLRT
ncbi:hypothetical protein [Streptomyces sp. NPDC050504]|uniref:hypothetical protein n=1 Tax=Streptomyces sp. NPDC050504 TaxID=3365618 RepID=UPI00379B8EE0